MRRTIFVLLVAAAAAACGSVRAEPDPDAAPPPTDVAVDAGIETDVDAPPPSPGQALTSAGGRVTGATFTMDVQLGHSHGQNPMTAATYRLEASTPVEP
jgi:hypothetical protein